MNKSRSKEIDFHFVPRPIQMMQMPAYQKMSLAAHRVLTVLEIAYHRAPHANGELRVTYEQIHAYGVRWDSIRPAINELVAAGIIEITRKGRSGNGEFRRATWYRLTYRKSVNGPASHEWRTKAKEASWRVQPKRGVRRNMRESTTPRNGSATTPETGVK
jgi:hypothetical protein